MFRRAKRESGLDMNMNMEALDASNINAHNLRQAEPPATLNSILNQAGVGIIIKSKIT